MSVKQRPICFVYLGAVESIHNNESESEFDLNLFVQFAKYYLKIPSTSLNPLLSVSKNDNGDKMFCDSCVKVVSNISNLYLEVVQVQHRLSWKLGELEKLMGNSQTSEFEKERVRELADNLGIADAAEVETIRELLSVQCEQMSKKFQPQLDLKRDEAFPVAFNDSVNSECDQIVKEEVGYSPENSDNDWDPLADDDEVGSNADETTSTTRSSSRTKHNVILMDSQIKIEEYYNENSDSKDGADGFSESGSDCSSSSEEDDKESRPSLRARKVVKSFQAKKVTKAARVKKVSVVSCEVDGCPEVFKTHLQLNSHLETHSESIHFCKTCGFGYIDVNLLRLHELTHLQLEKSDGKYRCPEAGCSFRNCISRLQDHYNSRHGVSLKRFKCGQCDYAGASSHSLKHHVRFRHDETQRTLYKQKQGPTKCVLCGLQMNNKSALVRHRRRIHLRKVCEICKEAFTGTLELKKHMLKTHPDQNQPSPKIETETELKFPCSTCKKAFSTVVNLERHEKSSHGEKVHECEICHKVFGTKSVLSSHRIKNHDSKPCPHCGEMFARGTLDYHILNFHLDKAAADDGLHRCSHCSLRYKRKIFLHRHIYKEHPDAPENLRCSKCQLKMEGGKESEMKKHELKHLTEKESKLEGKTAATSSTKKRSRSKISK